MGGLAAAGVPGKFLVDTFPVCKFLMQNLSDRIHLLARLDSEARSVVVPWCRVQA